MPRSDKPTTRRDSGGPAKKLPVVDRPHEPKYDVLPAEDRLPSQPGPGVPVVTKMIVVRDEQGQIVSVTKVAPGARFGVGVKPKPGQTVKEYKEGTFPEDPFLQQESERPVEPRRSPRDKKKR